MRQVIQTLLLVMNSYETELKFVQFKLHFPTLNNSLSQTDCQKVKAPLWSIHNIPLISSTEPCLFLFDAMLLHTQHE